MQEPKDPAFKLFGKTIPMLADGDAPVSSGDVGDSGAAVSREDGLEEETEKDALGGKPAETKGEDGSEESRNSETVAESNENPKTPSIAEENVTLKTSKAEKGQSDSPDSQEKTLKKPDKILPCPRCNSMDTKFCYYNNYNINQPRHFCKSCQRYWTAGGTMRNVPVGAGRRKNKNSASHYRHITISEALQTVRIEATNGVHQPTLKSNGTVLTFGSDAPFCDSMTSVLNLEEKKMPNGARNGFHTQEEQGIPVSFRVQENGDDHSSASSITVSNSSEEGSKYGLHEAKRNSHGVPSRIPCIPGIPWPYPWNSAVPPPFCPPGFPMPFYPAAYWNCHVTAPWNIPWLSPPSSSANQKTPNSRQNSPTLGKHSREGDILKPSIVEDEATPKQRSSERCLWVPKTLRIDDPAEAAKSSIWTTLGIKNDKVDSVSGGGLFNAFHLKGDDKNHAMDTSAVLRANPAALSRSLNFQESS